MANWYLLSYDIRDAKRLQRFHYRISKRALALQKSVFLVKADPKSLHQVEKLVKRHTLSKEDDVRLYPISHPNALWSAGQQAEAFESLYGAIPKNSQHPFKRFLRKVFGLSS